MPAILVQLGTLGTPVSLTLYLAQPGASLQAASALAVRDGVRQSVLLTPAHLVVLTALLGVGEPGLVAVLLISMTLVATGIALAYGLAILQGVSSYSWFNIARTFPAAIGAFLLPIVALADVATLPVVAICLAAGNVVGAGAAWMAVRRYAIGAAPKIGVSAVALDPRAIRATGRRALLGASSPLEQYRVDQAAVGLILPPAALGLYVTGVAFTNLPRFIAQSIGMVAVPAVAGRSGVGARNVALKFLALVVVACGLITMALALSVGWLLPLAFGHPFDDAVPVARILLIAAFFLSIRRVLADCAPALGKPGAGSIAEVCSWVMLLPLLLVLTPIFGVDGAAWALVGGAAASSLALTGLLTGAFRQPSAS